MTYNVDCIEKASSLKVMPRLSLLSKLLKSKSILLEMWLKDLEESNYILKVVPSNATYSLFTSDNTMPVNFYNKILYDSDKIKTLTLNSRVNLFNKYY